MSMFNKDLNKNQPLFRIINLLIISMLKYAVIQTKERSSDQFNCLTSMLISNMKKVCHLFVAILFAVVIMAKMPFLLNKTHL